MLFCIRCKGKDIICLYFVPFFQGSMQLLEAAFKCKRNRSNMKISVIVAKVIFITS